MRYLIPLILCISGQLIAMVPDTLGTDTIRLQITIDGDQLNLSPIYFTHKEGTDKHEYKVLRLVNNANDRSITSLNIGSNLTYGKEQIGNDLEFKLPPNTSLLPDIYLGYLGIFEKDAKDEIINQKLIPLKVIIKEINPKANFIIVDSLSFNNTIFTKIKKSVFHVFVTGTSDEVDTVSIKEVCNIHSSYTNIICKEYKAEDSSKVIVNNQNLKVIAFTIDKSKEICGLGKFTGFITLINNRGNEISKQFTYSIKRNWFLPFIFALIGIIIGKIVNSIQFFSWRYELYDDSKSIGKLIEKIEKIENKTELLARLKVLRLKIKFSSKAKENTLKTDLETLRNDVITALTSNDNDRLKSIIALESEIKPKGFLREIDFSFAYRVLRPFSCVLALMLSVYLTMQEIYVPSATFGAECTDYLKIFFAGFTSMVVTERVIDSILPIINKLIGKLT